MSVRLHKSVTDKWTDDCKGWSKNVRPHGVVFICDSVSHTSPLLFASLVQVHLSPKQTSRRCGSWDSTRNAIIFKLVEEPRSSLQGHSIFSTSTPKDDSSRCFKFAMGSSSFPSQDLWSCAQIHLYIHILELWSAWRIWYFFLSFKAWTDSQYHDIGLCKQTMRSC